MKMKNTFKISSSFLFMILFCLTLPITSQGDSETSPCPKGVVTISGILHLGQFFGPPGYGEDIKKDSIESSYYLQLPSPVNEQIMQYGKFIGQLPNCSNEHFVQIVDYKPAKNQLNKKIGKKLKLSGTLFESVTGHHRTHVLLEIKKVEAVSSFLE
jgi:hypothetical protein